ncbi:MAG: sugar phosphate isomerase/epimerase [Kiritimatiellae bacterium]|nr:sugar phosphate isomerase/epimerase [Kiritimatiellia bacterium]
MKLGLDSYSYHLHFGKHPDLRYESGRDIFWFLKKSASIGFRCIQIDPLHLDNDDPGYLAEVRGFCDGNGLLIEHGTGGTDPGKLKREIDKAGLLGAATLRTFVPGSAFDEEAPQERRLRAAVQGLKAACGYAGDRGVTLALENHGGTTSDEMLRVLEQVDSPHVGVCLDVGNWWFTCEDPVASSSKFLDRTYTTHFKDYKVILTHYGMRLEGCALGDGCLELERLFRMIRERAPHCDVLTLELPCPARETQEQSLAAEEEMVRASFDYARRTFAGHLSKREDS